MLQDLPRGPILTGTIACGLLACCGRIGIELKPLSEELSDGFGGAAGGAATPLSGGRASNLSGATGRPGGTAGSTSGAGAAGTGPGEGGSGDTNATADHGGEVTGGVAGAAGSLTGGSGPGGYCKEVPALAADPTIDGVIEPGLQLSPVDPVGWRGTGTVPTGYAMSFVSAWRPDGLYFFIEVLDPDRNPAESTDPIWRGDAVEIYVDSDAIYPLARQWDDPGARQFMIAAPIDDSTPSTRVEQYLVEAPGEPWPTAQAIAVPTPQGYDVETFIVALDLALPDWTLAAGASIGLDLAHDVSVPPGERGTSGNRDSQYFLKILDPPNGDVDDYPFFNENAFCTATLLAP